MAEKHNNTADLFSGLLQCLEVMNFLQNKFSVSMTNVNATALQLFCSKYDFSHNRLFKLHGQQHKSTSSFESLSSSKRDRCISHRSLQEGTSAARASSTKRARLPTEDSYEFIYPNILELQSRYKMFRASEKHWSWRKSLGKQN